MTHHHHHHQNYDASKEYMGNGPFNDKVGDVSTGRPEDSNLGWGMAEPAGSQYIWISMPFLSSWLGADTEISTYWWYERWSFGTSTTLMVILHPNSQYGRDEALHQRLLSSLHSTL